MFGLFKKSTVTGPSYTEQVTAAADEIIATGKAVVDLNAPFRMKEGEHYIASVPATLGTYKNNGNFGAHGLTVSVKIAKGVRYRAGVGQMSMQKSWVFDQPGILHITSDRLVFNGINKNSSVNYTKVINMSIDNAKKILYVDRDTGADWAFKLDEFPEVDKMATAFLFQQGKISG